MQEGADVTIVARNMDRLNKSLEELEKSKIDQNQKIHAESIDVSNLEAVAQKFATIEAKMGPIFMLVNCAGLAICGKTEDMKQEQIQTMLNTNYLGTLYPIQAVLKGMKSRQEGIIVITSSQAGLLGIYGYSVYASTKFALRGLAESLHMETKPFNISVTLALPADTDTPGLQTENESKPLETKLISASGGLLDSNIVAKKLLIDAKVKGNKWDKILVWWKWFFLFQKEAFMSTVGFESFMLSTLCVGMSPFSSLAEVILQAFLVGPFRLISSFYLRSFQKIVADNAHIQHKNKWT